MIRPVWFAHQERDPDMQQFTEHPRSVGETYLQHMASAAAFSGRMFTGALCCLLHAIFPFLFERTASGIIAELYDRMITNRARGCASPNNISVHGTDEHERIATVVSTEQSHQGSH